MNEATTIVSFITYRFRRLYLAFAAYLLVLAFVGHLPVVWIHPVVAGMLCLPFAIGLLMTIGGFTNVEAEIVSTTSSFSPWLLRLPIKTATLAIWPMLAAATWASASWLIFATLYLAPRGIAVPIGWPAAMFAALALMLQAIMWTPVRRGIVRLLFAMALPMGIALFGPIAVAFNWTAEKVTMIYLLVAAGSAAVAWVGLGLARTSPSLDNRKGVERPTDTRDVLVRQRRKPFRSPQAAQFWLEWRRQGRLLPLLTGFAMAGMSLPLLWSKDDALLQGSQTIRINIWVSTALPFLPWIPLLFATVIGMGARRSDMRGNDGVYHLYHATRPLQAMDLYRAKIRSITAGVLLTAAIAIATMLIWLSLPASTGRGATIPYVSILIRSFHLREWATMVGIAVTLTACAWRNQTVGAFVDYLQSREWTYWYPVAVSFIGSMALANAKDIQPYLQNPKNLLTTSLLLSVVLTMKIAFASGLSIKLFGLRPTSRGELTRAFASWAVVATIAAVTFGAIVYELPAGALPGTFQHPVPELMGALLVPLARPIAARIALELGRHR